MFINVFVLVLQVTIDFYVFVFVILYSKVNAMLILIVNCMDTLENIQPDQCSLYTSIQNLNKIQIRNQITLYSLKFIFVFLFNLCIFFLLLLQIKKTFKGSSTFYGLKYNFFFITRNNFYLFYFYENKNKVLFVSETKINRKHCQLLLLPISILVFCIIFN